MRFSTTALALAFLGTALSADLPTALQKYPEASQFAALLAANTAGLQTIFPASTNGYTVLVPTNKAFDNFAKENNGVNITSLSPAELVPYFQYHVMLGILTKDNITTAGGLTVPTLLKLERYNLRSPAPALENAFGPGGSEGQVVFISSDPLGKAKKLKVRAATGDILNLRAGLGREVNLTVVDGDWDNGKFQLIDSILVPPDTCSKTTRAQPNLKALDNALNRTDLWAALDSSRNVTCLAPSSEAFKAAGDPDSKLPTEELKNALLFHTLEMPTYSNFLRDGLELNSLANISVKVTVRGKDIWFNDAKVQARNVLTNNGLIHVLDKVMSPNGTAPPPSSTSSAAPSATSSKAAAVMGVDTRATGFGGMFGVALAALALL